MELGQEAKAFIYENNFIQVVYLRDSIFFFLIIFQIFKCQQKFAVETTYFHFFLRIPNKAWYSCESVCWDSLFNGVI